MDTHGNAELLHMAKNSTEGDRTRGARYRQKQAEAGVKGVLLRVPVELHPPLKTIPKRIKAGEDPFQAARLAFGINEDNSQRDAAIADRDQAQAARDQVQAERDAAIKERDTARDERDAARGERDELKGKLGDVVEKGKAWKGRAETAEGRLRDLRRKQGFAAWIGRQLLGI